MTLHKNGPESTAFNHKYYLGVSHGGHNQIHNVLGDVLSLLHRILFRDWYSSHRVQIYDTCLLSLLGTTRIAKVYGRGAANGERQTRRNIKQSRECP